MGPTASPWSDRVLRLRRAGRTGWHMLRREWRRGRLDLTDLPVGTRRLAGLAVALIGASALVVVVDASGWTIPGPVIEVAGRALGTTGVSAIPLFALLVACLGLCSAAAALAVADRLGARRLSMLGLVAIGLLGASISAGLINAAHALTRSATALPSEASAVFARAAAIIEPVGVIGIACGLLTIALAVSPRYRPRPWLLAVAATAPFLAATALVIAGTFGAVDLGPDAAAAGLPRELTVASFLVPWFLVITSVVATWMVPFGLWQVVTWTRASRRDIGIPVAVTGDAWPWLLAALLTLKLGWLGLGYLGLLPSPLLGGSPAWRSAVNDGVFAWVIAVGLAILAGWWLASTTKVGISERGFAPAAALVVVGFSLVTVLSSVTLLAIPMAQLLPSTQLPVGQSISTTCASDWSTQAIGNAVTCAIDTVIDALPTLTHIVDLGTLLVAAVLVIAWRDRRDRRSMVVFLAAVVVWVAPRVPDAIAAIVGRDFGPSIAPELTTLDTALTIVLAGLAAAWYAGRQRGAGPRALILVLVVATLTTLPSSSQVSDATSPLFVLALLFPIAYELLLDSEGLNRRVPGRQVSVLVSLGVRVGVLSLLALGLVLGDLSVLAAGVDQLGKVLFAVPFAALVVAATLSRRSFVAPVTRTRSAVDGSGPDRRRDSVVVVRGMVGAAIVLAVAVAIGGVVDVATGASGSSGQTRSPAPTAGVAPTSPPLARYGEFAARQQSVSAALATLLTTVSQHVSRSGGASGGADGADIASFVGRERTWLRERPPADCYAPAARAWEAELDVLDAIGRGLAGLTATSSEADIETALAPSNDLPTVDATLLDAMGAASRACTSANPSPS